jgi:hypothetical protein
VSVNDWTVVGSIATVIGVIAAIVLGVISLLRDREATRTAYAASSTTSGAPRPVSAVAAESAVSSPAPVAARLAHPAYGLESRRGIDLLSVLWALVPLVSVVLIYTIVDSLNSAFYPLNGYGFHRPQAWLGILALFPLSIPFVYAGIRLQNYKLLLTSAVYGLVALILWIFYIIEDEKYWIEATTAVVDTRGTLGLSLLALGVVATIHAFLLRRRVFTRPT